jgi:hypothetical protein
MIEDLTRAQYDAVLREDFASFVPRCFYDLNPQADLAMNWHLEVIAAKLIEVRRGRIKRLIINLPPRHLKSLIASIAFPAWCLGHDPSAQILCVSYAHDLADKFARDCRSIMTSEWYRQIFATRLAAPRQAAQELITTRQGYRLATSTGGVLTGRGADIILIDDPLKPEEALSEAQRKAANEWYDHTLYSRLNDKRHGAIVIIMQRLHEDDLVGHVLAQEQWEVLSFPAIAEADEVHQIETIWGQNAFGAVAARRCNPNASRSKPSSASGGRSANTISPASISNRRRRWAVAWSKPNGSSATARRTFRSASSASCRVGTPPTSRASSATSRCARRGVLNVSPFSSSVCSAAGSTIRRSSARCASSRTCLMRPKC